jgi:hypothetical protein
MATNNDNANETLVGVLLIGRHGQRHPLTPTYRGALNWPADPRFWKEAAGQLTTDGAQYNHLYGHAIRQRYAAFFKHLDTLPADERRDSMFVAASPFQRCTATAAAYVRALLPSSATSIVNVDKEHPAAPYLWHHESYKSLPTEIRKAFNDSTLLMAVGVMSDFSPVMPDVHGLSSAVGKRSVASLIVDNCIPDMTRDCLVPAVSAYPRFHADMYQLTGATGFSPSRKLHQVRQALYDVVSIQTCEMQRGLQPLANTNGVTITKAHCKIANQLHYLYGRAIMAGPTAELAQLSAFQATTGERIFLHDQIGHIVARVNENPSSRGLCLYVGHDGEISNLLYGLGYVNHPTPDVNATIIVELYRRKGTEHPFWTRLRYIDSPLTTFRLKDPWARTELQPVGPGAVCSAPCHATGNCELQDAFALAGRLSWCPICRRNAFAADEHTKSDVTVTRAALEAVIAYRKGDRPVLHPRCLHEQWSPDIGVSTIAIPKYPDLEKAVAARYERYLKRPVMSFDKLTDDELAALLPSSSSSSSSSSTSLH